MPGRLLVESRGQADFLCKLRQRKRTMSARRLQIVLPQWLRVIDDTFPIKYGCVAQGTLLSVRNFCAFALLRQHLNRCLAAGPIYWHFGHRPITSTAYRSTRKPPGRRVLLGKKSNSCSPISAIALHLEQTM